MAKREYLKALREELVNFAANNNIEIDSKISTKNLRIKLEKEGFETSLVLDEEIQEENTEEISTQKIEDNLKESHENVSRETIENNESFLEEETKTVINKLKEAAETVSKNETKKDNTWIWVLVAVILIAALVMLIRYFKSRNNGEETN